MGNYVVKANLLNLRSTPFSGNTGNIIAILKNEEVVSVTNDSNPQWYKVSCINRRPVIDGYAASQYLKPADDASTTPAVKFLDPVYLKPNPLSRRDNHGAWQYPLSEPDMPETQISDTVINRVNSMHQIVQYLAVDRSVRYQRDLHTYCNIYACDYCYLSGVFLPRVWWRDKSLLDLQQGKMANPVYNITVDEINANGLFSWLEQWGEEYNWKRTYDLDELQNKVNEGRPGVICAANINPAESGHICVVIPENGDKTATRDAGKIVCPLLSQAGAINMQYYNNNKWWIRLASRFRDTGFWYCG